LHLLLVLPLSPCHGSEANLNLDKKKLTDEQFFEFVIGFIDAEGNFDIR
jgi:hypothetical protein